MPFVYLGHLLGKLFLVALNEAAADDETGLVVATLFSGNLAEDGVDALLFGVADESAGVNDDRVAVVALAVKVYGMSLSLELSSEVFAVDGVLGAPQGDDVDFQV